ncbi:MAG: hypothetical protein SGPRY_001807 [Prymnesium sp.]
MEAAPQGSRLPVGVARALPSGWPRPLLPLAPQAHLLPIRCTQEQLVQHEAEEDEARLQLLLPSSQADQKKKVSLCPCRRTDDSIFMLACDECDRWFHGECVGVTEEEAEAVAKWVCKKCEPKRRKRLWTCRCGKPWEEDTSMFMLACDECDRWFHGECVGVTEERALSWGEKSKWRCKPCSAAIARRRKTIIKHCQRYCICNGYWDGRAFMIMCDSCEAWYHGNWYAI